jgi:hypothetical protein
VKSEVGNFEEFITSVLMLVACKIDLSIELLNIPLWDSMSQLVIAAWIHQETGKIVSVEELKSAKTVGD